MVTKSGVFFWRFARFHWDGPVHGTVQERGLKGWFVGWVRHSPIRPIVTVHCLLIVWITFVHFDRIYSRATRVGHRGEGVFGSISHQIIWIAPSS